MFTSYLFIIDRHAICIAIIVMECKKGNIKLKIQ